MKLNTIVTTILLLIIISGPDVMGQYQKVESHGLEVHYRIFGEGEPLLIIGGGPGDDSNRYLSLCDLLSKNHKCILVDQRGTGKSTPEVLDSITISIALTLDDFEAIRNQLGLSTWNVLGFSFGGYLASLYTNFFPESISSLVLLNSAGLNTEGFGYFLDNITSRMQSDDHSLFEYWSDSTRVAQDPHHALVERIRARMPGYFYDRANSLLVTQNMKDSDFNFEMGTFIWKDLYYRDLDLTKVESHYDKPVLILHGRQDPLGELKAETSRKYYKNSKLVFVEKAGHYSWLERPEVISEELKKFIR